MVESLSSFSSGYQFYVCCKYHIIKEDFTSPAGQFIGASIPNSWLIPRLILDSRPSHSVVNKDELEFHAYHKLRIFFVCSSIPLALSMDHHGTITAINVRYVSSENPRALVCHDINISLPSYFTLRARTITIPRLLEFPSSQISQTCNFLPFYGTGLTNHFYDVVL